MAADRLLILAKMPEVHALTRLSPPLTPDEVRDVYEASLRDVVSRAARERGRVEIWFDGAPDDARVFDQLFPGVLVRTQRDDEPGSQAAHAFDWSFGDGAERVVIIGADVPTLPEMTLTGAFTDLEDAPGVIAPSSDGGHVLLGLRSTAWPDAAALFERVPESAADVLESTLQQAGSVNLEVRMLPGWYSIDSPENLARAARDAEPDSHIARWLRSEAGRAILGA